MSLDQLAPVWAWDLETYSTPNGVPFPDVYDTDTRLVITCRPGVLPLRNSSRMTIIRRHVTGKKKNVTPRI